MNQSAGAAQHTRRYSTDGKVRGRLVVAVHCIVHHVDGVVSRVVPHNASCMSGAVCMTGTSEAQLSEAPSQRENKVGCCSDKLRGTKVNHVEQVVSDLNYRKVCV